SSPNVPVAAGARSSMPKGDPSSGRDLFYDLASQRSCHGCHAVHGMGGKVAPDLGTLASSKSEAELLSAIVTPQAVADPKFVTVIVTMADGDKIVGVKREEGKDIVRVYDTTVLPAVLRTLSKDQIIKIETSQQSIMPGNYGSIYTEKQLADIVAFIKSAPAKSER